MATPNQSGSIPTDPTNPAIADLDVRLTGNQAASPFTAAEFAQEGTLSGERAEAFGDLISRRINQIKAKPEAELSKDERSFAAWTADFGACIIVHGVSEFGLELPTDAAHELQEFAQTFADNAGLRELTVAAPTNEAETQQDALSHLKRLTKGKAIWYFEKNPALRGTLEDFAALAVTTFGSMVQASEKPVILDQEMAENLQFMLWLHEMSEPRDPATAQQAAERSGKLVVTAEDTL